MKVYLLIATIVLHFYASAQNSLPITFKHVVNKQDLMLPDTNKIILHQDIISIQTLKYYVSNFCFYQKNKVVWQEKNSYHLIDAEDTASLKFNLQLPKNLQYDAIQFAIGIDNATNTRGAMSGHLDPIHGMYWTWQSGYINFKLEGTNTKCTTPKNEFQYHIGGYQNPYNTLQLVQLPVSIKSVIDIQLDITPLLQSIPYSTQARVMQPCGAAVQFAQLLPGLFSIAK